MSNLAVVFDTATKTSLWPMFKEFGYTKSGNNFRYYSAEGWGKIVQLQKSRWNSAESISFTANIGLYLPEAHCFISGREAGAKFDESSCIVRKRIGHLLPIRRDTWYELTPDTDSEQLFIEVHVALRQYALPYLATINSREDIYHLLAGGYRSCYPSAQIYAMFHAGYKQAALELFNEEVLRAKNNPYYLATLRRLAEDLALPIGLAV